MALPWPASPVLETSWTLQVLDFVSAALGFEQQTGMVGWSKAHWGAGGLGHTLVYSSFLRSMFPDSPAKTLYLSLSHLMLTVTLKQAGLISSPHFIDVPDRAQRSKVAYSGHVFVSGQGLPA